MKKENRKIEKEKKRMAHFPTKTVPLRHLCRLWRRRNEIAESFGVCTTIGCGKKTLGPFCVDCIRLGETRIPPDALTSLYERSKVHLGTSSVIQEFLPSDLARIVFDYVHEMCKYDRRLLLNLHLRWLSFLYLL